MFEAFRNGLQIYISGPRIFVEVYYIAFPRFNGSHCTYSNLVDDQRARLQSMLLVAEEIATRFNADQRDDVSNVIIKKAFNRSANS